MDFQYCDVNVMLEGTRNFSSGSIKAIVYLKEISIVLENINFVIIFVYVSVMTNILSIAVKSFYFPTQNFFFVL